MMKTKKGLKDMRKVLTKDLLVEVLIRETEIWGSLNVDALLGELRTQYKVNSKKYQTYLGELALEGKIEVEDNTITVL